jgi:hypothetical protein
MSLTKEPEVKPKAVESTVALYWPGQPFEILHQARKYSIANGEIGVPESLGARLKSKFAINGMVDLPEDSALAARVKEAADKRNKAANRLAGIVALPKGSERTEPLLRNQDGAKLAPEAAPEAPAVEAAPAPPRTVKLKKPEAEH